MSQQTEVQDEPRTKTPKPDEPPASKNEQSKDAADQSPRDNSKRNRAILIFAVLILLAAVAGLFYWLHARQFEDTDDAQIDGNLSPIGARVDGTVTKVYVQNNQTIKVGDPLVDLDAGDNQIALAQVAQARGMLSSERPNVSITQVQNSTNIVSARADVAGAQAALATAERDRDQAAAQVLQQEAANSKAQNDLVRYAQLAEKQEISKMDFDQYTSNAKQEAASLAAAESGLQAAERTIDQRQAQLDQSRSKLQQNEQNAVPQLVMRRAGVEQQVANLQAAQTQVEQARLNLHYTKILAPVSGIVVKRSAQVGARVKAGQQILTIVETGDIWVTANFKETQLLLIRPGQPVSIHVDALDREFNGSIEAIGGSTGSVASLLPPENATGNYVKVVQRMPVRISFGRPQDGLDRLRPGMSVEPKVHVRD